MFDDAFFYFEKQHVRIYMFYIGFFPLRFPYFACSWYDRYNLTCTDGYTYNGVLFFGAMTLSPSITGNGGTGSSFLFQQNLLDVTSPGFASFPSTSLTAVQNCLATPTSCFPLVSNSVMAGNFYFGCGCPIGQYGPTFPSCTPCPSGINCLPLLLYLQIVFAKDNGLFILPASFSNVLFFMYRYLQQ
jgi:hypothetical protein